MGRVYVFADEAGNFDFRRKPGATTYFILCTVTLTDPVIGEQLLRLRRELAVAGLGTTSCFHATEDKQSVRDLVFDLLDAHEFRIDATILEKSKAQPQVCADEETFYQYAWYYHVKHVGPLIVRKGDEVLLTTASIGTKARRAAFHKGVEAVVAQVLPLIKVRTAFWPAASDPCLQIADYCTWAIQRKWERGDFRSYDRIKGKIRSEYDLWRIGTRRYY
jgi:hypothetical protein